VSAELVRGAMYVAGYGHIHWAVRDDGAAVLWGPRGVLARGRAAGCAIGTTSGAPQWVALLQRAWMLYWAP